MTALLNIVHNAGLDENENLRPGDFKMHHSIGEKEGTSYTICYDFRDPKIAKIIKRPGLTGRELPLVELQKCAVWLQAPSYVELEVNDNEKVTNMRGKLLGKDVGGEKLIDKVGDFFGALKDRDFNKAMSIAVEAAKIAKEILPTIGRMPFASELTGRTRAFAAAAAKVVKSSAPAPVAMAHMPSLGLGGSAMKKTRVAKKAKKESEKA